jgi:hypothetical protein
MGVTPAGVQLDDRTELTSTEEDRNVRAVRYRSRHELGGASHPQARTHGEQSDEHRISLNQRFQA